MREREGGVIINGQQEQREREGGTRNATSTSLLPRLPAKRGGSPMIMMACCRDGPANFYFLRAAAAAASLSPSLCLVFGCFASSRVVGHTHSANLSSSLSSYRFDPELTTSYEISCYHHLFSSLLTLSNPHSISPSLSLSCPCVRVFSPPFFV